MRIRTISAAAVLGAGLVLATSLPTSAHVTVSMPVPPDDGLGTLWFQVPSEETTAHTVTLTVQLPTEKPIAFVSTMPVDGWTVSTTTKKFDKPMKTDGFELTKAISSVTWTATGPGLAPGEFTQFLISGGPLPDSGSVRFPATQTYDDGTVVEWNQVPKEGAEEPEHPAPTLEIPAAPDPDDADKPAATDAPVAAVASDSARAPSNTRGNLGIGLGAAGLLAGLVALVVALRRKAETPT